MKKARIYGLKIHNGAQGRTWTGTRVKSRRILSPVRLPIPPLRHFVCTLSCWLVHYILKKIKKQPFFEKKLKNFQFSLIFPQKSPFYPLKIPKIKLKIILNSPFFTNIPSKTVDKKIKVCYNDNSRKYRGTYI